MLQGSAPILQAGAAVAQAAAAFFLSRLCYTIPRQHISEGKAARIAIKTKFEYLSALLQDRLDRSLRKYARSHPEFYHRLTAARQVIDRPGKQQGGEDEELTTKPQ